MFNYIREMICYCQMIEWEKGMKEIRPWSYEKVKKLVTIDLFSAHTEFQICIENQNFHEITT